MRKLFTLLVIFFLFIPVKGQDVHSIIQELKNTFKNYYLNTSSNYQYHCEDEVRISYEEPVITIQFIITQSNNNETIINESKVTFDVLKSNFSKWDLASYTKKGRLEIRNSSGIEVYKRRQWISAFPFSKPSDNKETQLVNEYNYTSELPVVNRLLNAFTNLQSIAKEKGVRKSAQNILDDAELSVKSISFISPDESGKIKPNQTGCVKIDIENTNSNDALEVTCVVKERNKSDMFTLDEYTSIDRIEGYKSTSVNIPLKASEFIDSKTYVFDVSVYYKGLTLKKQEITISALNPKKATNTAGGSRNKTIRMRKMAGNTYLISCKVNGLPLDFIFDTGASSVTLSRKQAMFMLKNGYLSKSDIVGSSAYQTASGDIAIGTVIKLKKIDINGLVLNNVEASIINSDSAPLLLGQSALSRLGKIQIDYKNSTLTIIK